MRVVEVTALDVKETLTDDGLILRVTGTDLVTGERVRFGRTWERMAGLLQAVRIDGSVEAGVDDDQVAAAS